MNLRHSLSSIQTLLGTLKNPNRARQSAKFFKTGKGGYAEHDMFIGIPVPELRKLALKNKSLSLADVNILLSSKIHEERLLALFILVNKFKKGTDDEKNTIYRFYLDHIEQVNNWDLVDSSAHLIIGPQPNIRNLLIDLSESSNIWHRRIAIISTWHHIKQKDYTLTLIITLQLLNDTHDLIHKAVGWMLREVGKQDENVLREFLDQYTSLMPRTMLRYAIERLPEEKRQYYLKK